MQKINASDPKWKQEKIAAMNRAEQAESDRSRAIIQASNYKGLALQFRGVAQEAIDLMRLIINATDVRAAPGIYFLLSRSGTVLYVGKSENVLFRMAGHKEKNFHSVRMIEVVRSGERDHLEGRFIHLLTPPLNVALTAFNKTKELMDSGALEFPQPASSISSGAFAK